MRKPTVFVTLLALSASLMTTTPARALDTTATSETTVYGSVIGSLVQTQSADDSWEVLTEEATPGRSGRSRLEHWWTFQVPSNNSVTFWVEGHRSTGSDDPTFGFSYSLDSGSSWTPMFDLTETVDTVHNFRLPAGTSGAVLIRVVDGDRTRGNAALDSVYVDHMYFVTDGEPPINTPPTAVDDSATTPSGGSVLIPVLQNDNDPDDGIDASTVVADQGSNGSTTVDGNGVVTYTHDGTPTTTDTFTYTVKDMAGQESNSASVTVTITPPNDPPIAGNDSATVPEGGSVQVTVLSNDNDPDDGIDASTVSASNGSHGITSVDSSGEVTYIHNGTENFTDTFTYTVKDNAGQSSNVATVSVTITPVNDAPTAVNDPSSGSISVAAGGSVDIAVLDNDTDPDDGLDVGSVVATDGLNGSISVDTNTGVVTYTHDGTQTTSDTFTYTVDDNAGQTSNQATVSIVVTTSSGNNPPGAGNDTTTTNKNTAISIPVLDNDSDPDGDSLEIISVSNPGQGTASITGNRITYTPVASFSGSDSFTYLISDGQGGTAQASVTINVGAIAPITVSPGANLAQAANNAGPGATIILQPGVYNTQKIIPLPNQTFVGYGAIMDGKRRTQYAFQNLNNVAGVTIAGIEVKNYKPGQYHGAIEFRSTDWGDDDFGPKTDWVLRDVWSHDNNGDGIFVGDGAWLYNVRSTDNKWLGVGGHGIDLQFFGGELARNSTTLRNQQIGNHSGGMKLTKARDVLISGMHVHNNGGPGIWLDVAILNATVEKSLIEDNQSPGIRYEISYDGFIRDNIFLRNGLTDPNYTNDPWVWGASIAIRTSRNVWVEDNFIADSGAGIIVIDMPHRDGAERLGVQPNMRDPQNREYASVENHIFRNTVVYTGRAGAAVGGSDPSNPRVFHMNEFDYNDYIGVDFWWENEGPPYFGRSYTWEEWHAVGNDVNTPNLLTQRPSTPTWSNPW